MSHLVQTCLGSYHLLDLSPWESSAPSHTGGLGAASRHLSYVSILGRVVGIGGCTELGALVPPILTVRHVAVGTLVHGRLSLEKPSD